MKITLKEQPKGEYKQAWFTYKNGVKLLIADANKPSFQRALELDGRQSEQELAGIKQITDESALKSRTSFPRAVSHLILGWQGLELVDEKSNALEYSEKNAELLCTAAEESIELVVFVLQKADELLKWRIEEREEILGKSFNSTNTKPYVGIKKKRQRSTKR